MNNECLCAKINLRTSIRSRVSVSYATIQLFTHMSCVVICTDIILHFSSVSAHFIKVFLGPLQEILIALFCNILRKNVMKCALTYEKHKNKSELTSGLVICCLSHRNTSASMLMGCANSFFTGAHCVGQGHVCK